MSDRGRFRKRGGRGRKRDFQERYEEEKPEPKPVNKRIVFEDSFAEEPAPPPPRQSKKPHLRAETSDGPAKSYRSPDESVTIAQGTMGKFSGIWRSLDLRSPFHNASFFSNAHTHRPMFNLTRLIFYKIHERSVDFLKNTAQPMLSRERWVDPKELLETMSSQVLKIEVDGEIYDFHAPNMMDYILQLLSQARIIVQFNRQIHVLPVLRRLCQVKKIEANRDLLEQYRNVLLRNVFKMGVDFLKFAYIITVHLGSSTAEIQSMRPFLCYSHRTFYNVSTNLSFTAFVHYLSPFKSESFARDLMYSSSFSMLACEESDHLLESVFQYGLLRLLPAGAKEFLGEWMISVRKRMRKRLVNGELENLIQETFKEAARGTFTTTASDKRLHVFLRKTVGKMLNTRTFTVYDGDWEEYALEVILEKQRVFLEPSMRFFETSELINIDSRRTLTNLFSNSPNHKALLYHTFAQLLRFVVAFVIFTIRHVFHHQRNKDLIYDGQVDEEYGGFSEFEVYESNPAVRIPMPEDVPTVGDTDRRKDASPPDIHPVQLRMMPMEQQRFADFSVPPPGHVELQFQNERIHQEFEQKPVKTEKKSFFPMAMERTSNLQQPPVKMEEPDVNLSAEVTEEELFSARALRTPSEVASESATLNRIDEDEDIPETWRKSYRLILEWNKQLLEQRDRVEARYNRVCKN